MVEPPTALVEPPEAAPGEDHEGSWLVSALREQAEPAGEPPKSYWDAYLGIPWVIRETLLRSSNVKLIARHGLDWTEESVTTLVSKVQRLRLDGSPQEDAHPIDGSKVRIWSAVGARPRLAPPPDAAAPPPPPGAIVTVMEYVGYDAVSTITRTVDDGAYVVKNDLLKRKTREAVSTTSVFVRDDACC